MEMILNSFNLYRYIYCCFI